MFALFSLEIVENNCKQYWQIKFFKLKTKFGLAWAFIIPVSSRRGCTPNTSPTQLQTQGTLLTIEPPCTCHMECQPQEHDSKTGLACAPHHRLPGDVFVLLSLLPDFSLRGVHNSEEMIGRGLFILSSEQKGWVGSYKFGE